VPVADRRMGFVSPLPSVLSSIMRYNMMPIMNQPGRTMKDYAERHHVLPCSLFQLSEVIEDEGSSSGGKEDRYYRWEIS
jgi:hypothetical protein